MSDLLDQIQARIDAAKAIQPAKEVARKYYDGGFLPPEAAKTLENLGELHPGKRIEIERRLFVRVYDSNDICIDVRNLPDQ